MSRRKSIPSYRLHKQSGQAVVTLPNVLGGRRDYLLGKYYTPESRLEYARVLAEWEATGRRVPVPTGNSGITVSEVILAYYRYVEQNYRRSDGSPSRKLDNDRDALRPLWELYGHAAAGTFGPKSLKTVQKQMIGSGLCRNTINRRIGRIKSMFGWAESEEMVPPSTLHALKTVRGLPKGRSAARETLRVRDVAQETVDATLPFMLPMVADMVRLQLATGMRPGELVLMRRIDLEMSGQVWGYRPGSDLGPCGAHKTAHYGYERVVSIGPRGQEIVRKYLKPDLDAYLFSPKEALEEQRAENRRNRKTKVQPSQRNRRKRQPKRAPGGSYRVGSYATAIRRAVVHANKARACDSCKPLKPADYCPACKAAAIPHWHPHQLRHTAATEISREAGLDVARAVLGHRSLQITAHYAEIDVNKAKEVMARLG
jgi:integrase